MREIKFRAWDKEERVMGEVTRLDEMVYVEYLSSKPVTSCLHCAGLKCSHPHKYISNTIELMQYTGLKDRYGKEIYEGDIVELANGQRRQIAYAYCWARYMLSLDGENCIEYLETYCEPITYSRNIEVIGNIYENPELLESE